MVPVAALAGRKSGTALLPGKQWRELQKHLEQFKQFPGTKSVRIDVGNHTLVSDSSSTQLFVASAIKTFIVCQYLRDVEAGRVSEDEQLEVSDSLRTDSSPVLLNLTGTTPARSILEASITHSDNTATDIALVHVGPDRVRSFIAAAGLKATLIPDSTRRFFSYNVGAPLGVDLGWAGIQQVLHTEQLPGPPRPPLNNQQTLASSADDFVSFYKRALAGKFFNKPATLTEFKRIHLNNTFFPDDTAGYGKGGSLLKLIPTDDGVKVEEVYYKRELTNKHGGLVLVGDYVYGDRDDSGHPFCAEVKSGKVVWKRERGPGSGSAAVTYADGHLYFRYDNGIMALVEASPKGYKEVSSFKIPNADRSSWAHPVVVGGKMYLREKDAVWCYDVKQP